MDNFNANVTLPANQYPAVPPGIFQIPGVPAAYVPPQVPQVPHGAPVVPLQVPAGPSTPQVAEVYGLVTKTEPKQKVGGKWPPSRFTILAPKSGWTIEAVCEHFCRVEPEDTIYAVGEFSIDARGIRRLNVTETPIIEPGVSKTTIVTCFIKGFYYRKDFQHRLQEEKADQLFSHLAKLTLGMEKLKELDAPNRVNQYMVELSNELRVTGKAGLDKIIAPLRDVLDKDDASSLLKYWYLNREIRRLHMIGMRDKEIKESPYNTNTLYEKVRNNPFTVPIISMERCHELCRRFGITPTQMDLACGEIVRSLYSDNLKRKWSHTPYEMIVKRYPHFNACLEELTRETDTLAKTPHGYDVRMDISDMADKRGAYLRYNLEVEVIVSDYVTKLMKSDPFDFVDPTFLMKTLSDDQLTAIKSILRNRVNVMSGGGGTGKTTCIAEVVHNLDLRKIPFMICSFTGKAVARVKEVLLNAQLSETIVEGGVATLHRAIYGGVAPPHLTHLIIDETSMVTTNLLAEFFKKFPTLEWILMVGDCNQLLPISWGCLFNECIVSKRVPVYYLTVNHRVYDVPNEDEKIKRNCELIATHPDQVAFKFEPGLNFHLEPGDINKVESLVSIFHQAEVKDYQLTVVTPRNKDRDGINLSYQKIYRRAGEFGLNEVRDTKQVLWRAGDRVIMLENNYDINVMNGEEGRVIKVDAYNVTVSFHKKALKLLDDELKDFAFELNRFSIKARDLDERWSSGSLHTGMISHAYSLTVHKSQGSEWDFIFFYIPMNLKASRGFFNRNLLYTGVSRGKRCVHIIGNIAEATKAATLRPLKRYESICARLTRDLPETKLGMDNGVVIRGIFTQEDMDSFKYFDNNGPEYEGDDDY